MVNGFGTLDQEGRQDILTLRYSFQTQIIQIHVYPTICFHVIFNYIPKLGIRIISPFVVDSPNFPLCHTIIIEFHCWSVRKNQETTMYSEYESQCAMGISMFTLW
jgi:hypothetical protein